MQPKQAKETKRTHRRISNEFLYQSSIHGLKIFILYVPSKIAKKLWFGFIMLVIFWTHFIIVNLTIQFLQQPTELHMSTNLVHVANSPFPGIAICSANKISRRKLLAFSEEVFHAQQLFQPYLLARNVKQLSEELIVLAGFYLHPYKEFETNYTNLSKLHNILRLMYNNTRYPIRDILHNLAPDCEDFVIRGTVFGERFNISDILVKRTTSNGICCMFNYQRESYSANTARRYVQNKVLLRTKGISFESNTVFNSVQFVAQMDMDDIIYKDLSNEAFQLNIFPSEDYASVQSNTIGELLVDLNTIIEVSIQPRFFTSSKQIRNFRPRIRKCYFPEEGRKLLNLTNYSLDECLLVCRMKSMVRYCGCVSPPMIGTLLSPTYCGITDLPCLYKWKSKWFGWDYFDYVTDDDDEKSSYEGCGQCLPTCDGVEFDFYWNTLPLRKAPGGNYSHGLLTGLSNSKPLAVIKFFFQNRYAQETIGDVVADWILLLNRFGGILSLMYGFSIISYIEIIYYLTGKWFFHVCSLKERKIKPHNLTNAIQHQGKLDNLTALEKSKEPSTYFELYWGELNPKRVGHIF